MFQGLLPAILDQPCNMAPFQDPRIGSSLSLLIPGKARTTSVVFGDYTALRFKFRSEYAQSLHSWLLNYLPVKMNCDTKFLQGFRVLRHPWGGSRG